VNEYTDSDPGNTADAALPIDPESAAALAAQGLERGLVDPADADATRRWLLADARGFHDATPSDESLAAQAKDVDGDRVTAVWDRSTADPETPVATVRCWEMGLTVPGGDAIAAWAISSVTVSPTHRRRGIARALLTSELRTAKRRGLAMAMLTVSEATIYGRYGFGPSAHQAPYTVDTVRARWAGPTQAGRVQFVSPESLLRDGPAVFERARRRSPGEVDRREGWWKRALGLVPAEPGPAKRSLRAVRYDDADGTGQGFALYTIVLENGSFPGRLELADLVAATDDAYAALWRYLIEMDLVSEIRAPLRSVSEPVAWQLADRRTVRKTDERDHLWLRILDVPATLARRRYFAPGEFVLEVADDLGFAGGEYLLAVGPDGRAAAHPLTGPAPLPAARVALSVADLAALYLGGGSAVDLARAGRLVERTTDAAARLDSAFRSPHTPHLSTWF
jgi:predicted acetyltransferase